MLRRPSVDLGATATADQLKATAKFVAWLEHAGPGSVFALAGYAGTGKTFLATRWIAALESAGARVAAACYTNRAAAVLRRGGVRATTLHKLLYAPENENDEMSVAARRRLRVLQKRLDESESGLARSNPLYDHIEDATRAVSELEAPKFADHRRGGRDIVFVDESSMVTSKMAADIGTLAVPVVYIGDPGQLPPVSGAGFYHKLPKNATLEQVVRHDDNGLLAFAAHARKHAAWGGLRGAVRDHEADPLKAVVESASRVSPLDTKGAAVALCHTNRVRHRVNKEVRRRTGRTRATPEPGEILVATETTMVGEGEIARVHNGSCYIVNAIAPHVEKGRPVAGVLRASLVDEDGPFDCLMNARRFEWAALGMYGRESVEFAGVETPMAPRRVKGIRGATLEGARAQGAGSDDQLTWKAPVLRFDFGYGLTVHRAQGGEWETVVLFDDHFERRERTREYGRWLYTAITRASRVLMIGPAPRWPASNHDPRALQELRRKWRRRSVSGAWALGIVEGWIRGGGDNDPELVRHKALSRLSDLTGEEYKDIQSEARQAAMTTENGHVEELVRQACIAETDEYNDICEEGAARTLFEGACRMREAGSVEEKTRVEAQLDEELAKINETEYMMAYRGATKGGFDC